MAKQLIDLRDLSEEYTNLLVDEREERRQQKQTGSREEFMYADQRERLRDIRDFEKQLPMTLEEMAHYATLMIHDDYFEEYAKDRAEGWGYIQSLRDNPLAKHIDWTSWAEQVREDFERYTFAEETYWVEVV